ncbi:unnamed protein product [Amoebophrya sp. A120]|nr:unnamed protein product [Amoebophrya sp. A120]|eukprot:GSA120T00005032001.1
MKYLKTRRPHLASRCTTTLLSLSTPPSFKKEAIFSDAAYLRHESSGHP